MSEKELEYLKDILEQLDKAKEALGYSLSVCANIGKKDYYTVEEQDRFEALTSKFARLSDLILKKAIKAIDILDLDEPPETMRDAISRAEKKNIIDSELKFVEIRKMRNEIAHDYSGNEEQLMQIYSFVLDNAHILQDAVGRIKKYTQKFINV